MECAIIGLSGAANGIRMSRQADADSRIRLLFMLFKNQRSISISHASCSKGAPQMVRRGFVAAVALFIIMGASSVVPTAVGASARFHATLVIPNDRINASQSFTISFSTTNVPGGARILLQREFGTAKVWKSVERLHGRSGSATAPAVPLGQYLYRVDIVVAKTAASSPPKKLYAYGAVPFQTVCAAIRGSCDTQTEQIGTTIFTYVWSANADAYPRYSQDISEKSTTCRTGTLQLAQPNSDGTNDAYLQIIQSASDPENGSTVAGTIGTFAITFDGGPWILNVASSNLNYGDGDSVQINGTFDCYSTTGL